MIHIRKHCHVVMLHPRYKPQEGSTHQSLTEYISGNGKDGQKNPLAAEMKNVVNYLLDLINQGEAFYVINMPWFPIKTHHNFCSCNICSLFSCLGIYEDAKHTLQYLPNKYLQLTTPFIVYVWPFHGRKLEYQELDLFLSIRRFFKMCFFFCSKKIWHWY